ncbi:hypothetical protein diail_8973 [Diaporthe ilicicola]|nr:hypothetical protein diail_8973 [Diaporthe ilicicola]
MADLKPRASLVRDPAGRNTLFLDECLGQDAIVSRFGPRYQQIVLNGGPTTIFFDYEVRSFAIAPDILRHAFNGQPSRFQHIADLEPTANYVPPGNDVDKNKQQVDDDADDDEGEDEDEDEDEDEEAGEEMILDDEAPGLAGSSQATEKIPPPFDSWQIFLVDKSKGLRESNPNMSAGEISTEAARQWKAMSDESKGVYQAMAEEAARQHKIKHPDRYRPAKK